jgi:hypothetical protein
LKIGKYALAACLILLAGSALGTEWLGESYCNGDPWLCGAQKWLDSGTGSGYYSGTSLVYDIFKTTPGQNNWASGQLGPYRYTFATTEEISSFSEPSEKRTVSCCTDYSVGIGDILPEAGYKYETYLHVAKKDRYVGTFDTERSAKSFLSKQGVPIGSITVKNLMIDGQIGSYAFGYDPILGMYKYVAVWKVDDRSLAFLWSHSLDRFAQLCSSIDLH